MTMTIEGFIIGLGITLVIAFLLYLTSRGKVESLFSYLLIGIAFSCYAGYFDIWILTLDLSFVLYLVFQKRSQKSDKQGNFLINYPLSLLIIITLFQMFISGSTPTTIYTSSLAPDVNLTFNFDAQIGLIATVIGIASLTIIFTIQILGTGVSETGGRTLQIIVGYVGFWLMLSVFSSDFILDIPLFGIIFYLFLTMLNAIGLFKKMNGEGE